MIISNNMKSVIMKNTNINKLSKMNIVYILF